MRITASAVALRVDGPGACAGPSAGFLTARFGFRAEMSADGFVSLARDDAGMNVIFLRRGRETLPAGQHDDHAPGRNLAFEVGDLDGELARLEDEGAPVTRPLTAEDGGERAFQVRDPSGVVVQLLDWNASAGD